VGASQELIDRHLPPPRLGYADVCDDAELLDADLDVFLDDFDQRQGNLAGYFRIRMGQRQGEFVVANSSKEVARVDAGAQAIGQLQQHGVAAKVPVHVVQLLELAEPEQQQRHFAVGAFQRGVYLALELPPVGSWVNGSRIESTRACCSAARRRLCSDLWSTIRRVLNTTNATPKKYSSEGAVN